MDTMTDAHDRVSAAAGEPRPPLLPPPPLADVSRNLALFLDFDGTLVEIADHPDRVLVLPGLAGLVARLAQRLDGRLAIVTGRSLASLEHLLGPLAIAVAGSHGGEFRPAGTTAVQPLAPLLPATALTRLRRFAQDNGGLLVEAKPFSAAAHYRDHPLARDALLAEARRIADDEGLGLTHGKMVVELTTPGADKGTALTRFMQQVPFTGASPLFIGDDTTDEHAFAAARTLGGSGILVGPERETAARWRLDGVTAVHQWLKEALA